jgi:hypothetical protein
MSDQKNESMKTLIENLYSNNVLFSYYGFVDESVLKHVLEITKSRLDDNNESAATLERVHNAIKECVEHIISHNFFPDDIRVHYKSLLIVSKHKDDYNVDSINVINSIQKETIHKQLEMLQTKNHEELMKLKSNGSSNGQKINTGLVDLVLKSENCDCTFRERNVNHLFKVNYRISCLN